MSPRHTVSSSAAYTLLELSLVLAVLSLLIAGIMSVVTQSTRRTAMAEVKRKMDVIEAALTDFRRLNGRLPCPADGSLAITNQYFGIEGTPTTVAATTCLHGSTYSSDSDLTSDGGTSIAPDANFYDGTNTVAGDVPIKTLGLSDDYMFDPWGGRFFYAVDNRITVTSGPPFTTYGVASTSVGRIAIVDGALNYKINIISTGGGAIAVVMSFGPDGHGAFQLSGVRKATGNSNSNTQVNCHCNGTAAAGFWAIPTVFVQAPATSTSPSDPANFDDIVRYYTRSSFLSNTDVSTTR